MSESSWPRQPYEDQQPNPSELYPPQPADPYGQQGGYPHPYEPTHPAGWGGPPGPPPKRSKTGLVVGLAFVGAALVVVLIIVGISALGGDGGSGPQPAPQPTPTAAADEQLKPSDFRLDSGSSYPNIDKRVDDADPLTLDEIFGLDVQYPDSLGYQLVLTGKKLDENHCQDSVWGDQLKGTLAAAECKEHVRGAYVEKAGNAAVQFGIFNVKDNQLADKVAKALDPEGGGTGFPIPLPDERRPWETMIKGGDEARVEVRGHYVMYVWSGRPEGSDADLGKVGIAAGQFKNFVYPRNK